MNLRAARGVAKKANGCCLRHAGQEKQLGLVLERLLDRRLIVLGKVRDHFVKLPKELDESGRVQACSSSDPLSFKLNGARHVRKEWLHALAPESGELVHKGSLVGGQTTDVPSALRLYTTNQKRRDNSILMRVYL